MPGPSGNEDGNVGSFPIPALTGQCGHYGGGNPPTPRVHPMQHAGTPAGNERKATFHSSVSQGSRANEAAARGGGSEGDLREGLRGIRGDAGNFDDI